MVGSRSCSHCCLYCHGVAWWAVFQRSIFCVREKNGCPEDKQEKKFSFNEGLWQLKDFCCFWKVTHLCIALCKQYWFLTFALTSFLLLDAWAALPLSLFCCDAFLVLIPWSINAKDLIVVEGHLLLQSLLPGRWLLVLTSFVIMLHWSVNSLVNKQPCCCLNR